MGLTLEGKLQIGLDLALVLLTKIKEYFVPALNAKVEEMDIAAVCQSSI